MSSSTAGGRPQTGTAPIGPAIGGPTASSWREQALTRIAEIEDLADAFREPSETRAVLAERIHRHVEAARQAAEGTTPAGEGDKESPRWRGWWRLKAMLGGSPLERTASNMDAAEADLLRLAPAPYLEGQMPGLLAHVRSHLPLDDPRRQELEVLALTLHTRPVDGDGARLDPRETNAVVSAVRAASSAARREIVQVRSFRNILYVTSTLLAALVAGLLVLATTRPDLLPLCFAPDLAAVCPTGVGGAITENPSASEVDAAVREAATPWDVPLVALIGLIAAAISATVALRKLRGTTTPYSLPVALAILKLPTGALTAIFGLLLMRGEFVPGLSALDSPEQILAWAVLFGYAQQLFTRLVDERAHGVLDHVGGQEQPRDHLTDRTRAPMAADPRSTGNGAGGHHQRTNGTKPSDEEMSVATAAGPGSVRADAAGHPDPEPDARAGAPPVGSSRQVWTTPSSGGCSPSSRWSSWWSRWDVRVRRWASVLGLDRRHRRVAS